MVKANYVRLGGSSGGEGRARFEASASYYGHRPDERGERHWRPAFGADREGMSKEEARGFVREAEGAYGYRMVLSPGRDVDADGLRQWTREVMSSIEADGGTWIGFAHDDHTSNPHAHVVAFVEERFDVEDFFWMREQGDEAVELYMAWAEELERDPLLDEDYYAKRDQERDAEEEASELEGVEHASGDETSKYEVGALRHQAEIFESDGEGM